MASRVSGENRVFSRQCSEEHAVLSISRISSHCVTGGRQPFIQNDPGNKEVLKPLHFDSAVYSCLIDDPPSWKPD